MRKLRLRGERHLSKVTLLVTGWDSDQLFPHTLASQNWYLPLDSHFALVAQAEVSLSWAVGAQVLCPAAWALGGSGISQVG